MNSQSIASALAVALFFALLTGCATQKPLYYWGEYEALLLDIYASPGDADPNTQIEKLTSTIQRAQNQNLQVAPGVYAHLGMVYAQQGNPGMAAEALRTEKQLYPESADFIDGLLKRAGAKP